MSTTTGFKHSERCLKLRQQEREDREAFLKLFPKACQDCGAKGFVTFQEGRGEFWEAPCSEQMMEACEECLALAICPRCSGFGFPVNFNDLNFSELKCSACGWTEKSEALPEVLSEADCGCFEDWLDLIAEVQGTVSHFQLF